MTWARLDDGYYAHPKVRKALTRDPASLALFSIALSWSAFHHQDGHVPDEAMDMLYPNPRKRERALEVLVDVGMIYRNGDGWVIHDYLDYNESKEEIEARRAADRERKASQRKGGR